MPLLTSNAEVTGNDVLGKPSSQNPCYDRADTCISARATPFDATNAPLAWKTPLANTTYRELPPYCSQQSVPTQQTHSTFKDNYSSQLRKVDTDSLPTQNRQMSSSENMASMTNLHSTKKPPQQTQPGPTQLATLPDELLVHVLSKVGKEHRVGIRTVSQKWKNIISDLGYHIKPLFVTNGDHCLPYYPEEIQIHMNPVTSAFCYGLHDAATRSASCPLAHVGPFTSSDAQAKRSEFITSPPITTICISIWSFVEQRTATGVSITVISTPALMRSDQGIRVGDLVDVIDAVEASVPDEIPIEQRYAWFATVMGYGKFELVEEAKGKGGIEVRARRKNP